MSGAPRSSAGMPFLKKRSPGPNSTMLASTNCRYQLFCVPMVSAMTWWNAGTMWAPISRMNTGNAKIVAMVRARLSDFSSAAWRSATASVSLASAERVFAS